MVVCITSDFEARRRTPSIGHQILDFAAACECERINQQKNTTQQTRQAQSRSDVCSLLSYTHPGFGGFDSRLDLIHQG